MHLTVAVWSPAPGGQSRRLPYDTR